MSSEVWIALGLTVFAGMATGIGSAIAFFAKRTNYRFLSIATGFSAGVMLYVSFVEILVKGREEFASAMSGTRAEWYTIFAFFGGIGVIALIDALVPSAENPHELHAKSEVEPLHNPDAPMPDFKKLEQMEAEGQGHARELHVHKHKLMRMGLFTALAIGIHNFPEGLATFLAALKDPALGVPIAIAIALHNIPEGISVSVPIFYATGHRGKAFFWSVMSGLSEPIGAMIAFLVIGLFVEGGLSADPPAGLMGTLFAGVAGVMVYISLDELLPTSRAYGKGHDSLIGLLAGMAVMALSLVMM